MTSKRAVSKTDERYVIVEEAICGAFLLLVKEKDPHKITVLDITKRAGIVRSTFYNHYSDVGSLIIAMEDKTLDMIFEMLAPFHPNGERGMCRQFFLSLCNYTKENRFVAALTSGTEGPEFMEKAFHMFHRYVRETLRHAAANEDEETKKRLAYAIAYALGGVLGILHKWVADDFRDSQEQIADTLTDIFIGGTMQYFIV